MERKKREQERGRAGKRDREIATSRFSARARTRERIYIDLGLFRALLYGCGVARLYMRELLVAGRYRKLFRRFGGILIIFLEQSSAVILEGGCV